MRIAAVHMAANGTKLPKNRVRYLVAMGGKADSARIGQNRRD